MTDDFTRRCRGATLGGLGSGFLWGAVAAAAGAIWGGHWGFKQAGQDWGGFESNVEISASIFVYGLIGVVTATTVMATLLMAWSLLTLIYASPIIGIIVCAAVGYIWWKGLALGHWVAGEVGIYEAEPMVLLPLGSMWVFALLLPTLLLNGVGVWIVARRR